MYICLQVYIHICIIHCIYMHIFFKLSYTYIYIYACVYNIYIYITTPRNMMSYNRIEYAALYNKMTSHTILHDSLRWNHDCNENEAIRTCIYLSHKKQLCIYRTHRKSMVYTNKIALATPIYRVSLFMGKPEMIQWLVWSFFVSITIAKLTSPTIT